MQKNCKKMLLGDIFRGISWETFWIFYDGAPMNTERVNLPVCLSEWQYFFFEWWKKSYLWNNFRTKKNY